MTKQWSSWLLDQNLVTDLLTNFTDVTLVNEDTYGDEDEEDEEDKEDEACGDDEIR